MKAKLSKRLLQVSLACATPEFVEVFLPPTAPRHFQAPPTVNCHPRPHSHKQAGVRVPLVRGPITPVPPASSHYLERLQSPDPRQVFLPRGAPFRRAPGPAWHPAPVAGPTPAPAHAPAPLPSVACMNKLIA